MVGPGSFSFVLTKSSQCPGKCLRRSLFSGFGSKWTLAGEFAGLGLSCSFYYMISSLPVKHIVGAGQVQEADSSAHLEGLFLGVGGEALWFTQVLRTREFEIQPVS
jgi:hypothetical protein